MSLNLSEAIKYATQNPFGVNFETVTIGKNTEIYIPFGSAINLIGYNDYLEQAVGVSRVALGLFALATSSNNQHKLIAAGHVLRGAMEMYGKFEKYLLIIDVAFTIFNISQKYVAQDKSPAPAAAE